MIIEQRLKDLEINLPAINPPTAAYVSYTEYNNLVFIAGQAPRICGKTVMIGKVGKEISLEQAYEAAKICAINILAHLKHNLGDLDRIKNLLYVRGYVASSSDFYQQSLVINGASEFFELVLGERGRHARCSVGVMVLPGNVPVEVEAVIAVK